MSAESEALWKKPDEFLCLKSFALFAFNSVKIENKFFTASHLIIIIKRYMATLMDYDYDIQSLHMQFFNDFPPLRFDASLILVFPCLNVRVTKKSAINIECHVGYYEVLIDCLTTTFFRVIVTETGTGETLETWCSRSQETISFHFSSTFLIVVNRYAW